MGLLDKMFDKEKYDYTNDVGLKIKHLENNKTKYVLTGELARKCELRARNVDEIGSVMDISCKVSYKDIGDTQYKDYHETLSIPSEALLDYKFEKNFLRGNTISFVVDDNANFYASGHVYVSPYCAEESRTYSLADIKIDKECFEKTFKNMDSNCFFDGFPTPKSIEIPISLRDKIKSDRDEFGYAVIKFKDSSFYSINGHFKENKNSIIIYPDTLQNGWGISSEKERDEVIGKWVEEQLALKKEEENKNKESEKAEKPDKKDEKVKEGIKVVEKYIPSGKYLSDMPKNEIGKFKFERKVPSLKVNIVNGERVNEK